MTGSAIRSSIDISIVTPTFNRAQLLGRLWNSMKDAAARIEWIVVDDGSIDETSNVINSFDDIRIVYQAFPENRGVNAARNAGAVFARGRYVIFIDSDDELYPGALESVAGVMDNANGNVGVALFPCVIARTGKQIVQLIDGKVLDERDILCYGALEEGDMICVYRREIFDYFLLPENLRGCEQVFVYEISKKFNFLMINKPLSIIHRQSDNLSNAKSMIARSHDIARSYEIILKNHNEVLKDYPSRVARYLKKALYRYGVAGSRRDVWRIYTRLIRTEKSLQSWIEATGILILCMAMPEFIERWRINRLNKQFTEVR